MKSNICSIKNDINATIKETRRRTGYDLNNQKGYIKLFNISALFDEINFEDSKSSYGLQTADLLISSVNRCLKANFSENEMMAVFLGRLMLDSIYRNETAILFPTIQSQSKITIDKHPMFMGKIMNKKSQKIVSRKIDK
jgi:GGDEF domain-containing protein